MCAMFVQTESRLLSCVEFRVQISSSHQSLIERCRVTVGRIYSASIEIPSQFVVSLRRGRRKLKTQTGCWITLCFPFCIVLFHTCWIHNKYIYVRTYMLHISNLLGVLGQTELPERMGESERDRDRNLNVWKRMWYAVWVSVDVWLRKVYVYIVGETTCWANAALSRTTAKAVNQSLAEIRRDRNTKNSSSPRFLPSLSPFIEWLYVVSSVCFSVFLLLFINFPLFVFFLLVDCWLNYS